MMKIYVRFAALYLQEMSDMSASIYFRSVLVILTLCAGFCVPSMAQTLQAPISFNSRLRYERSDWRPADLKCVVQ